MEWICVNDKMPYINELVLAYSPTEGYGFGLAEYRFKSLKKGGRWRWLWKAGNNKNKAKNITHWMKLERPHSKKH